MRELNTVVIAPIHNINNKTVLLYSINGELLIKRYTPAVTIVAACIKALTGVGKYVDWCYIRICTNTTPILNNLHYCSDYIFDYYKLIDLTNILIFSIPSLL